ncbi:MAG: HEPN domain-containing protein [Bacteroidota bacterium]|nr:HEPN domain-containing protein [Bacteroidota bacterium]
MKRSVKHLPTEKQRELQEITAWVKENIPVHMIILFGSYARGNWVEDAYVEYGITYEYRSDYDLLLVVDDENTARTNKYPLKIKRKISKNTASDTPVNVIYHGIDYLNKEIEQGNYFFSDILKEGIRLFNSRKYKLSKPLSLDPEERLQKARQYFERWFESANEFMTDYYNAFDRGSFIKAIFELHQAAENYFMCLLLVRTDYKPKTHDLEELLYRSLKLDARFKTVFPRNTEEEKQLFNLLKKAYIDSRYKMGYEVKKEELEYLGRQVERLKGLVREVCLGLIKRGKQKAGF